MRRLRHIVVLVALASFGCSSPSSPIAPATPAPVFGCPPVPLTPARYPPTAAPFAVTFDPDPVWVGFSGPVGDRTMAPVHMDIRVDVTGQLYGSVTKVHRVLRDRDTNELLEEKTDSRAFLEIGNTPCRVYDPLLLYGHQSLQSAQLNTGDLLGFRGRPAILNVDVTVVDTAGREWTASKSALWQAVPSPIPRSPLHTTVRQNDPTSGCPFDPVHGNGIVLDFSWEQPPGPTKVSFSGISLSDNTGRTFGWHTTADETTLHAALCNTHFDAGADQGVTWSIFACFSGCYYDSDFGQASFDFQSCREAGVPACQ